MRIREFVSEFRAKAEKLPRNKSTNDVLVNRESQRVCDELQLLCWGLADSDRQVSEESLKPFITFLAARHDYLSQQFKQAGYTSNYKTDANDLCIELAKMLADVLHCTPQSAVKYLIPSLKLDQATASQFIKSPQHYVLNDDATKLIDHDSRLTTPSENARIEAKSQWIKDAHQHAINYQTADCRALKKYLYPTREQLLIDLESCPLKDRREFLKAFAFDELADVLLNGASFRAIVNNKELYAGDENYARSILMALAFYYHELTNSRVDDYKHYLHTWNSYPKQIKLKGVNFILDFLESDDSLKNFPQLLESDDCRDCKDAMLQGELGDIAKMITTVGSPINRGVVEITEPEDRMLEQQPSKSWFSWRS